MKINYGPNAWGGFIRSAASVDDSPFGFCAISIKIRDTFATDTSLAHALTRTH